MRKSIRMYEVREAIEQERDFYVRSSQRCLMLTGVQYSMAGWHTTDGRQPDVFIPSGQMPEADYQQMLADMREYGVAYYVLSYRTVIGWKDGSGQWHLMPHRYSLQTTQHQWTLWSAVGHGTATERVIMDDEVKIGRPGF